MAGSRYGRRRAGRAAILPALLVLAPLLAGCESFGRGLASAVIDRTATPRETEDTRLCEVQGRAFPGIEPVLAEQDALPPIGAMGPERPQLKVLYVHGIGTHEPQHSLALIENLQRSLGLDVRAPRSKRIALVSPLFPGETVGELNVWRLTNQARSRDLVFYELTWSSINQPAKEALAFDRQQVFAIRRAGLNQRVREFINDALPDPLAYTGVFRERIVASVGQSLCWIASTTWSDLPEETAGVACGGSMLGYGTRLDDDKIIFITHSLGSRITIDALQRLLAETQASGRPEVRKVAYDLRQSEIQVFMLSNQLPLIEVGQAPQAVTNAAPLYCGPGAPKREERWFAATHVIAFTDPNDLLSYPIPESWAEKYLDSRLCADITNVTINIASVNSLFGLGEVANPLAAHSGYGADERVGGLIAKGAGQPGTDRKVIERCTWIETDEALMK